MAIVWTSSGDVLADRRFSYAEAALADGDATAAVEVMRGALEIAPDWVAGWVRLGEMAVKAGEAAIAREAFENALSRDPADHFGAGVRLDLLRPVRLSDRVSAAHVEGLFDHYAPKFEASLITKLGYRVPYMLADVLPQSLGRVLDLGCGTGLMGQALVGRFTHLTGFDLSTGMLREAKRKGIYDVLEQHDLLALEPGPERYDLIVAADVFIYIGALERVVAWVAGALEPQGRFAFTVEEGAGGGYDLQDSHRYAHAASYIEELLEAAGFAQYSIERRELRMDRGQPVNGLVVVAQGLRTSMGRAGEDMELA